MNHTKQQLYAEMSSQAAALVAGETDQIANMANLSALLYWGLKDVNWAGFYLVRDQQLVLGPFQGKPACIRIPIGKGVCGTAVSENSIQLINDVHQFAGHIACDAQSNSEIVIPIEKDGKIIGVLDLDSPIIARFDHEDKIGLINIVNIFVQSISSKENC
ncbi:GAF domain-containing protein [Paraglaciecola sp. L3A3]|uniref:GAF domain-containing protein n=1 Tax=Paraglaciecola sp. L3A3 TaxID=2686358 RepID=UPI00131A7AE8|nr:GAF domain-containing protein [Paraglaciecola sp. L3A3]